MSQWYAAEMTTPLQNVRYNSVRWLVMPQHHWCILVHTYCHNKALGLQRLVVTVMLGSHSL